MGFTHAIIAALIATGSPGEQHIEIATLPNNRNEIDFFSGNAAETAPAFIAGGADDSLTAAAGNTNAPAAGASLVLKPQGVGAIANPGAVLNASGGYAQITAGGDVFLVGLGGSFDTGLLAAWAAYVPSWSGVIGNGAIVAAYRQIGKIVWFRIKLTWGTTTTHGAGGQVFGLPVAARVASGPTYVADTPVCQASFTQTGVKTVNGVANWSAGDKVVCMLCDAAGTFVTNAQPFAWATGHQLQLVGTYEAA